MTLDVSFIIIVIIILLIKKIKIIDNPFIGDEGMIEIAESLKLNNTLIDIDLTSKISFFKKRIFLIFFCVLKKKIVVLNIMALMLFVKC